MLAGDRLACPKRACVPADQGAPPLLRSATAARDLLRKHQGHCKPCAARGSVVLSSTHHTTPKFADLELGNNRVLLVVWLRGILGGGADKCANLPG